MQTKLTLSLEKQVIEQAKEYARKHGMSLSKLVQVLLQEKTTKPQDDQEIEVPEEFKGIYGAFELPEDFDYKKEKAKWLIEKYERLG